MGLTSSFLQPQVARATEGGRIDCSRDSCNHPTADFRLGDFVVSHDRPPRRGGPGLSSRDLLTFRRLRRAEGSARVPQSEIQQPVESTLVYDLSHGDFLWSWMSDPSDGCDQSLLLGDVDVAILRIRNLQRRRVNGQTSKALQLARRLVSSEEESTGIERPVAPSELRSEETFVVEGLAHGDFVRLQRKQKVGSTGEMPYKEKLLSTREQRDSDSTVKQTLVNDSVLASFLSSLLPESAPQLVTMPIAIENQEPPTLDGLPLRAGALTQYLLHEATILSRILRDSSAALQMTSLALLLLLRRVLPQDQNCDIVQEVVTEVSWANQSGVDVIEELFGSNLHRALKKRMTGIAPNGLDMDVAIECLLVLLRCILKEVDLKREGLIRLRAVVLYLSAMVASLMGVMTLLDDERDRGVMHTLQELLQTPGQCDMTECQVRSTLWCMTEETMEDLSSSDRHSLLPRISFDLMLHSEGVLPLIPWLPKSRKRRGSVDDVSAVLQSSNLRSFNPPDTLNELAKRLTAVKYVAQADGASLATRLSWAISAETVMRALRLCRDVVHVVDIQIHPRFIRDLLDQTDARKELAADLDDTHLSPVACSSAPNSKSGLVKRLVSSVLGGAEVPSFCAPRVEFMNYVEVAEAHYADGKLGGGGMFNRKLKSENFQCLDGGRYVSVDGGGSCCVEMAVSPEQLSKTMAPAPRPQSPQSARDIENTVEWLKLFCWQFSQSENNRLKWLEGSYLDGQVVRTGILEKESRHIYAKVASDDQTRLRQWQLEIESEAQCEIEQSSSSAAFRSLSVRLSIPRLLYYIAGQETPSR